MYFYLLKNPLLSEGETNPLWLPSDLSALSRSCVK